MHAVKGGKGRSGMRTDKLLRWRKEREIGLLFVSSDERQK